MKIAVRDGMKIIRRFVCCMCLMVAMLWGISGTAWAEGNSLTTSIGLISYIPVSSDYNQSINLVRVGDRDYLFMPACANKNAMFFHFESGNKSLTMVKDGKESPIVSDVPVNISKYLSGTVDDGSQILKLRLSDANGVISENDIYILFSKNIDSMFICSADPNQAREYVDASKSNKAKGSLVMLSGKGNLIYAGGLGQIKGRGNTTFKATKKPYQIKLENAADLTQTGNSDNSNKTWVLLANAYDPTLIHNTIAYRMAKGMGLNSPDSKPVDLYYDGNYRGNYLLSEKVEVSKGRVSITNLEKQTEDANAGKDISKNATATSTNKYGDTFQYVTGVASPANIAGGYLLEQDDAYYKAERSYFITSTGTPFVVKSPENCSKEQMEYISSYVEEMIQAAAAGGVNPTNGKSLWEYLDKESIVRYFVVEENVKNADAFSSSAYFYLDADGKPMKAGPVWDFDDSYGIREDRASTDAFASGGGYIDLIMNVPDFRSEVKKYYASSGYSAAINAGIDKAVAEISASQKMNRVLWNGAEQMYSKLETYDADVAYMKTFANGRAKWLKSVFATW